MMARQSGSWKYAGHIHMKFFVLGSANFCQQQVELISGPGCPVCVTPVGLYDEAIYLALEKSVTICTFGDLVRVPGSKMSLAGQEKKEQRSVSFIHRQMRKNMQKNIRKKQVVFLSVGFETTTPAECLSVKKAKKEGITNYSILIANKTMPQAYEALKGSADIFLYPGHVNAITGTKLCEELVQEGVSGVVAGFTAKELLTALAVALAHFQKGKPFFVNCYPRVVTEEGSKEAQRLVDTMMEACDSEWRGLGMISGSGLRLRDEWDMYDARKKYQIPKIEGRANPACRCGGCITGKM